MGMRALQEKRLGTALTWCLRSQDASFATYLAEKFLTEYSLNGNFSNLDLIDNLGSSMLVSDRLTFLGKTPILEKTPRNKKCTFFKDIRLGEFYKS